MKLIKSAKIEEYVNNNKKEAEYRIPELVKRLINNTIDFIEKIDVPSGDSIIQTGFDGIIKLSSTNKYLGGPNIFIEIGTDKDYIPKANKDIEKRKEQANIDTTYVFITPYSWNNRKTSKSAWIESKKTEYKWKDINIIDAEVLENWLGEDFATTKWFFELMGESVDDVYSIKEMEKIFQDQTKKNMSLDFFDYDEINYEEFLKNLTNDNVYKIKGQTKEELLYCTLYYLKKIGLEEKVLIIENEEEWKNLYKKEILKNLILIPDFRCNYDIKIIPNNIVILLFDIEEVVQNFSFELNQRKISNLSKQLQKYYDVEEVNSLISKSLGKYSPLKREIFKSEIRPEWFKIVNDKKTISLILMNSFEENDLNIFKKFSIDVEDLKEFINKENQKKDPFIVSYKYRQEYRIVNTYECWEWIYTNLNDEILNEFKNIVKEVLFYQNKKYNLPEEKRMASSLYIKNDYSELLKKGILKSLILYKVIGRKNNSSNLYFFDDIVSEYYNSINNENEFLTFSDIASELAEYDYEMYLEIINKSLSNLNFQSMFNLSNADVLFSQRNYCKILWGIEKILFKKEYVLEAIDVLLKLNDIPNAEYKNNYPRPSSILAYVFMPYDNLTCLSENEKKAKLEQIVKTNKKGKEILLSVFPRNFTSWTALLTPEYDIYDEAIPLKYVKDRKQQINNIFNIYVKYCISSLEDLCPIFEETYFVYSECYEKVNEKLRELINKTNDKGKIKLKELIRSKLTDCNSLSEKEKNYLNEVFSLLEFDNKLYDYLHIYDYYHLRNNDQDNEKIKLFIEDIKDENLLVDFYEMCYVKTMFVSDFVQYNDDENLKLQLLKYLLENKSIPEINYFMRAELNKGGVERLIELYKNKKLDNIPISSKLLIINSCIFDRKLYNLVNPEEDEQYWKTSNFVFYISKEDEDFVYSKYLEYKEYLNCLTILHEKKGYYEKKYELLKMMSNEETINNSLCEHYIKELLKDLRNSDYSNSAIAEMEIKYFYLIKDENLYSLSKEIKNDPELLAEMVSLVFKSDGNESEPETTTNIAFYYYSILEKINVEFNGSEGIEWTEKAIKAMKDKKRSKISYHIIGKILSKSKIDSKDNVFPTIANRKVIEQFYCKDLEESFVIEVENSRGVHYIGDGSEEKEIANRYKKWAEIIKVEYPKTSKILNKIGKDYENESKIIREKANYARWI